MLRGLIGVLLLLGITARALAAGDAGPPAPPRMDFTPPPAGSYRLPPIQAVGDALLLDARGRAVHLRRVTQGKITLLTFFYTYCVDPLGCPFARETLVQLRDRVLADPALAREVRFVGITCDPSSDTPAAIADYAAAFASRERFEWRFLTAASVAQLLPVLEDLGQEVSVDVDAQGRPTRALHHMLKVFLIDEAGRVREIYTLSYLQPEVMFNDIRTLFLASHRRSAAR